VSLSQSDNFSYSLEMKAMIFAAGIGSRLKEYTKNSPKCLMDIGGITILEHVIQKLKAVGVTVVVINLHHFPEQITEYLKRNNNFGLTINLSYEAELLDTGGGLKRAREHFEQDEDFFVHNSDIYCSQDLSTLLALHQKQGAVATLGIMRRESKRGLFFNSENQLIGWTEETVAAPVESKLYAFSGISICSGRIFDFMNSCDKFSIIESYLSASRATGKVFGSEIALENWVDIGTPEKLTSLKKRLAGVM
jgi:MurNAc alpha-1-phosphate uridylyltransferase